MIFDFHVHLFPEKLFRAIWSWFETHGWVVRYQVQADEAVRLLREQGISRFVLLNYSHKPGMSESLNQWTYEFCKKYPTIVPFGAIHPEENRLSELLDQCFQEYHFYGIKFHSHVTGIRPDDERMFPIYEKMIEYDRVLLLHSGVGPSLKGYREQTKEVSGAKFTQNMLKRFPKMKVVVPHLGADEIDLFLDLMEEYPNLWMDTTMVLSDFFPLPVPWDRLEKMGDRILYGSDFPNIPYDSMTEIKALQRAPLKEETKEKIFWKNAVNLLGLRLSD